MLCVDVSGTMEGDPLKDTRKALLSFLARARPEDRIALVSFADEDKIESSFEETREYLAEAVRNLQARGKWTVLYQALYKSLDTLQSANLPKRRRIMVISDGKDEGSAEGPDSVIAKSRALGIPIDAVGCGKIEKQYAEALRGLANTTGGRFVHALPDIVDLTDAIARIYRDLLETRSLVVCFMYEMDEAGRTIQNALIELQRPGEPPLRVGIPEDIPRIKPSPDRLSWLFWLLLVMFLGIGLVVLVRRRLIEKKGKGTYETD
ncbi:MAG: VWA domain-containing protein, partial [Desulfobulbaceae bacterium]|nr:VWA domain-containing protein [Desulfobulbaceae bacterium]